MVEAHHADGARSLRVVRVPDSAPAVPTAAGHDRRPFPRAPDRSLWFDWLRRFGDGQDPRRRDCLEPRADGVDHRRRRLEALGGTAPGAATTSPTRDSGAPE